MFKFNIIFWGEESCGQTQLICQLKDNHKKHFAQKSQRTVAVDFTQKKVTLDSKDILFVFWDLSGQSKYQAILSAFLKKKMNVAVYCVDLSKQINTERLANYLKRLNPGVPVLLVGTKADLASAQQKILFEEFAAARKNIFAGYFTTSANTKEGVAQLEQQILQFCHLQSLQLNDAAKALLCQLTWLPEEKKTAITAKLKELFWVLHNSSGVEEKNVALQSFSNQCTAILEDKYAPELELLHAFTAQISVSLLTGMLGFGIGFALGAWAGPGIFLTELLSRNSKTAKVVKAGIGFAAVAGLFSVYLLSKPSKEMTAVNEFVEEERKKSEIFSL